MKKKVPLSPFESTHSRAKNDENEASWNGNFGQVSQISGSVETNESSDWTIQKFDFSNEYIGCFCTGRELPHEIHVALKYEENIDSFLGVLVRGFLEMKENRKNKSWKCRLTWLCRMPTSDSLRGIARIDVLLAPSANV